MVTIHFKEKDFNINSREDLSKILDKISEDIKENHKEVFDGEKSDDFMFELTLTVARMEFKHEILNYFYGKED